LCTRHGARVVAAARRSTRDAAAATDIAQDVWLSLWRARKTYEPRTRFASYLATLVHNRCRNEARSRARSLTTAASERIDAAIGTDTPADGRIVVREDEARLLRALDRLDDEPREAVVMRYVEELSYEAIEELTQVKTSTLRSRVFYALKSLRAHLKESER
jgi:RNA polymerase sigma-70 factor (ECF subfamily)